MQKKISNQLLLIVTIFVFSSCLLIGYASLSKTTLLVNGTASATGITSADDFDVKFKSVTTTSSAESTKIGTKISENGRDAEFTVTNMIGYGDTATIKYTIVNESKYFQANFKVDMTNTNTEYFLVTKSITNSKNEEIVTLEPGAEAILTIKGKVIKIPTDSAKTTSVTLSIHATSEPYTGE